MQKYAFNKTIHNAIVYIMLKDARCKSMHDKNCSLYKGVHRAKAYSTQNHTKCQNIEYAKESFIGLAPDRIPFQPKQVFISLLKVIPLSVLSPTKCVLK
jgi:hypothetical protein